MINKILQFKRNKDTMLKNFLDSSVYMKNGNYRFSNHLKYIYLEDETDNYNFQNYINEGTSKRLYNIFTRILKILFYSKKIEIINSDDDFKGTLYLPANNNLINIDAKIFNFKKKEVLSIFTHEKDFKLKINETSEFLDYFNIPLIKENKLSEKITKEDFIEFIPHKTWGNKKHLCVLKSLLSKYSQYFEEKKFNNEYLYQNLLKNINDIKIEKIAHFFKRFEDIIDFNVPTLRLHGDLWPANILISKHTNEMFIIDWEHSDDFMLFYDVFWYMQYEFSKGNDSLIKSYIKGEFDYFFKQSLSLFDISFSDRKIWFLLFYLNVFTVRLEDKNKKTNDVVFDRMIKMLDLF